LPQIDSYFVSLSADTTALKKDLVSAAAIVRQSAGEQQAAAMGASQGMEQLGLSATVAGQNIDGAMRRSSGSITEARAAARLLEESFGIHLPRELTTFMAKAGSIGPMLTAAFDVAVPIAFAAALIPIGVEVYKWVEGLGKAVINTKDVIEQQKALDAEMANYATTIEKIMGARDKIGKSGADLIGVDINEEKKKIAMLTDQLEESQKKLQGLKDVLTLNLSDEQRKGFEKGISGLTLGIQKLKDQIDASKETLTNLNTQLKFDNAKTGTDQLEKVTAVLQKQHDQIIANLATQGVAAIEAEKKYEEQFGAFTTFLTKGIEAEGKAVDKMIGDMAAKPIPLPGFSTSDPTAERAGKAIKAANDAIVKDYESTYSKIEHSVSRTFDQMERGIADSIVHWKGFGDTVKSVFDDLATSAIRTLEKVLFSGIEKGLTGLLSKFAGGGGLFGSASLAGAGLGLGAGAGGIATGSAAGLWGGATSLTPLGAGAGGAGGGLGGLFAAGSGLFGLSAAATAGIAAAVAIATYLGIQFATGPSSWQAADKEIARDLGLDGLGNAFASWCASKGISEERAWPWRKELYTSPSFIAEVAAPYAQQGGHLGMLLGSLSRITTNWGTFNLQAEATEGVTMGSWYRYNQAWNSTIGRGAAFGTLGTILDEGGVQTVNIAASSIATSGTSGMVGAGINYSSPGFQSAVLAAIRNSYNSGGLDFLAP
jgi:hypothetical protein